MRRSRKDMVCPFSSDRTFPYMLLGSTFGSIVSLATAWLVAAQV
jgi:hypothetical protein